MFSVLRREEGQGLAEYALILALIALVVIGVFTAFGTNVFTLMDDIATHIRHTLGSNCRPETAAGRHHGDPPFRFLVSLVPEQGLEP